MAIQNYTPMRLDPNLDQGLRNDLLKVDRFLRQLTPFAARVPVFPQGTAASTIDLTQFLFLPGRAPLQRAFGNVTFSAGRIEQTALDDSVLRGFVLEGGDSTVSPIVKHSVYFQPDNDANATIVRKWIFPSITSSPTDTFTFASTSGAQTITGKTIVSGIIQVGTNSAANTFRSTDSGTKEFKIAPVNGFPTTGIQTPTLKIPQLDTLVPLVDRHMFMMLHASISAPFTTGSIPYGNSDGSEMEMVPTGVNGTALRFNIGETVAGVTWTNGATTMTGVFDTSKSRIGMRIRGDSGSSIYVDENTRITTATSFTLGVDTPLVGTSVGTTIQTFGPTWDSSLSGVSHSSLADLTTSDDHPQYLYLAGRAGGQVLGSSAHTGGLFSDLTIEGRLLLGDGLSGINFTSGRAFDVRHAVGNNTTLFNVQSTTGSPIGAASGTIFLMNLQPGNVGYTSGSYAFTGFRFLGTASLSPSGVTVTNATVMNLQNSPTEGGDPGSGGSFGSISIYRGGTIICQGSNAPATRVISVGTTNTSTAITSAGLFVAPIAAGQFVSSVNVPGYTLLSSITDASNAVISKAAIATGTVSTGFKPFNTEISGLRFQVSSRSKPTSLLQFIDFVDGGSGNVATTASVLGSSIAPFDSTDVNDWAFLRWPHTIVNPATIWFFNITGTNNSRHAGNFRIGGTATPTNALSITGLVDIVSTAPSAGSTGFLSVTADYSATSGAAGGASFTGFLYTSSGNLGYSSGSFSHVGFNITPNFGIPTGVTGTTVHGANIRCSVDMVSAGNGQLNLYRGLQIHHLGPTVTMAGTGTEMTILDLAFTPGAAAWTTLYGCNIRIGNSNYTGTATNHFGLRVQNNYLSGSTLTNHIGLQVDSPNVTPSSTNNGIIVTGTTLTNRIEGQLRLGSTTAPSHLLDIAAGTTTVAPARLASGTNLTTPLAGVIEYDGATFYNTHSDAVRTKVVTQRGAVDITGRTTAIGSTTLYSPSAAGYYVVHYTIEDTTADVTAGTIQFQINYTDDIGATNQTGAALALTVTGRDRGSFQVYSASGTITYQTNLVGIIGTAQYALRVRLQYLG